MKLFSVSAYWHPYKAKRDMVQTSVIMAETREEAEEKFKANVSYPENAHLSISEWKDGIYTLSARRTI